MLIDCRPNILVAHSCSDIDSLMLILVVGGDESQGPSQHPDAIHALLGTSLDPGVTRPVSQTVGDESSSVVRSSDRRAGTKEEDHKDYGSNCVAGHARGMDRQRGTENTPSCEC